MQSSWKTLKCAHSVGSGLAARAGGSLSLGAEGHGFGGVGAASQLKPKEGFQFAALN